MSILIWLAIAGVFIAQFLAWVKIKAERDRISGMKSAIQTAVREAKYQGLLLLREKGMHIVLDAPGTEEQRWQAFVAWIDEVTEYLRVNFSPAHAERFYTSGEVKNRVADAIQNQFFEKNRILQNTIIDPYLTRLSALD